MSIPLEVLGKLFLYPDVNEEPGWGEDATKWAREVTRALDSILGPNAILRASATITNNASTTSINLLSFNSAELRSSRIDYNIYRTLDSTELAETGYINIVYKTIANEWMLSQVANGDAGVIFTITPGGQIQYTSTNMGAGTYAGTMKFQAIVNL